MELVFFFGDVNYAVDNSLYDLEVSNAEGNCLSWSFYDRFAREMQARELVHKVLQLQEMHLKDKSQVLWLYLGNRNTNCFSLYGQIKKTSSIFGISSCGFHILDDPVSIQDHIVTYSTWIGVAGF